jgi:hypothetical protein
MTRVSFAALLTAALLAAFAHAQEKPNRIWKSSPDGVEVLAATFLGGSGTEWLASGGFQPNGNVVLVGNVLGPTFDLSDPVGVIGTDRPAPAEPEPIPVLEKGKPKIKDGQPVYEKPSWRDEGVTGFVAIYSPDLQKRLSVHRLPWTAGAVTAAAVGPDGAIYVVGRATDGIVELGGNVAELPAMPPLEKKNPARARCDHAFVARLSADASRAIWVRHVRGPSAAPTVDLTPDGKVRFGAGHLHLLDGAGKSLSTVQVPGGLRPTSSVRHQDGQIVVGGEHNWSTGREPWRCPTLDVHNADGSLKHRFYDWGGPYVGLDNCRQVSDTAVRSVSHDRDGGILLYLWSDGGNSVAVTQPFDIREPVGLRGLGMTTAGAGVLSVAYFVRLDPQDYRATAWTVWVGNGGPPRNRPNSTWVEQLTRTADGSLAFAGVGAWGVWQTADKLTDAEPEGRYLAVLNDDFTGLRHCSVIPGVGAADLNDGAASRGSGWGIATGTVNGKSRVLFLAGSKGGKDKEKVDDVHLEPVITTPTRNAAQERFGGGRSDGYVVLMELATPAPRPAAEVKPVVAGPSRAHFERHARTPVAKKGSTPQPGPEDGTVFHFLPTYPKWVTVDAEIRDQSGRLWPGFMYGKPVSGTLTATAGSLDGEITVACTSTCQREGEPARRVLGELLRDPENRPTLVLRVGALGPLQTAEIKTVDKGKDSVRTVEYREGQGTLEFAGKKLPVTPRITTSYNTSKDTPISGIRMNAYMSLPAGALGLAAVPADELIDIRVGMTGTTQTEPPPKK